jgi:hypothetical protein
MPYKGTMIHERCIILPFEQQRSAFRRMVSIPSQAGGMEQMSSLHVCSARKNNVIPSDGRNMPISSIPVNQRFWLLS